MFEPSVATIVGISGSRGGTVSAGPGFMGFGPIAFLLLGVCAICVITGLIMVVYLWPDDAGMVRKSVKPKSKESPPRCQKCGYDLRASPEYCPECGTPRPKVRLGPPPDRGPAERGVASVVHFRAGAQSVELRIAPEQHQAVQMLRRACPQVTELILPQVDPKRPTAIASETLAAAAEELLRALASAGASPALERALRRLRQFARQHEFTRVHREVDHWRMTG